MTRNPVVSMLAGVIAACFAVLALCVLVMLSGCALDTTNTASADELSRMTSKASLERLVEEFESVPETREEVAKGLVRRGRKFFSEHPDSHYTNMVVIMVGNTVASSHINASTRAKGVWVLGEIGDRKAKPFIAAAHGGDSTKVGEEVAISLAKLGFTEAVHGMELLADGYTTVDSYDPDARGHVEEVE